MANRLLLTALVSLGVAMPASAGIFSRKPKVDPAEHVPALIMQLKTDKDDGKRAVAAEELRNFDPKVYPEMMTVLADAALKDSNASVRSESVSTIAKLRPVNQQAGFALEQAAANDPSMRVRFAAKQALWQYNLLGYRSGKPQEQMSDSAKQSGPALAPPPLPASKQHVVMKNLRTGTNETAEPPLADGTIPATSLKPASPPLQPVAPPKLLTPPKSKSKSRNNSEPDGPSLGSPN